MTQGFRLGETFDPNRARRDVAYADQVSAAHEVRALIADARNVHGRTARRRMYAGVRRYGGKPWAKSPLVVLHHAVTSGQRITDRTDRRYVWARYFTARREGTRAHDALIEARWAAGLPVLHFEYEGGGWGDCGTMVATTERLGVTLRVELHHDLDGDPLEGVARLSDKPDWSAAFCWDRQRSEYESWRREGNRYIIYDADYCPLDTIASFRKRGQSKAVARDAAWAQLLESIAYVEKVIRDDVRDYGVVVTATIPGDSFAGEASCWGVDATGEDDEHLLDIANECIVEVLHEAEKALADRAEWASWQPYDGLAWAV